MRGRKEVLKKKTGRYSTDAVLYALRATHLFRASPTHSLCSASLARQLWGQASYGPNSGKSLEVYFFPPFVLSRI